MSVPGVSYLCSFLRLRSGVVLMAQQCMWFRTEAESHGNNCNDPILYIFNNNNEQNMRAYFNTNPSLVCLIHHERDAHASQQHSLFLHWFFPLLLSLSTTTGSPVLFLTPDKLLKYSEPRNLLFILCTFYSK